MSVEFKFDFSPPPPPPSEEESGVGGVGGGDSAASRRRHRPDAQSRSIADANDLIAHLMDRSKSNAGRCTIANASSGAQNEEDHAEEANFKPLLRFHPQESIDLHSRIDALRHVTPKHTMSDESTDLIPGVYEGGLKVWECSVDLCRFLASSIGTYPDDGGGQDDKHLRAAVRRSIGPGGSCMEIGCGHGLPGLLILREGIRRTDSESVVIFSDFNDFVLHHATIPNAQLNVCGLRREHGSAMDEANTAKALMKRSIFVGGDWMGLSHSLSNGDLLKRGALSEKREEVNRLDLILASETTYTPQSCEDTAFLMLRHLKIDVGVGIVATKRFYFGVGGGTDLFTNACERLSMSDEGIFSSLCISVRRIRSYDTGNANIRDLLEVRIRRE